MDEWGLMPVWATAVGLRGKGQGGYPQGSRGCAAVWRVRSPRMRTQSFRRGRYGTSYLPPCSAANGRRLRARGVRQCPVRRGGADAGWAACAFGRRSRGWISRGGRARTRACGRSVGAASSTRRWRWQQRPSVEREHLLLQLERKGAATAAAGRAMATLPPLKLTVRAPDGLSLLTGPPFSAASAAPLAKIPCSASKFSQDGAKLAVTTPDAVVIYDTDSGKEVLRIPAAGVASATFSPLGTYLQTFQKPQGQQKNLTLWDLNTGSIVLQQFQRAISKASWPVIQFSEDESVACRLVTNEAHIFDGHDFSKGIVDKLRLPGIDGIQLAHSPASHIAAYVPEIKGAPANVRIFELANVSQAQSVARRSFFKSNTAQLMWNKGSTGCLVLAQSDVDKTNQSYYGETRLHFLTSDGCHEGAVPLSKEGPIHDVQWSPNGTEFLVVYGFMPAKATLFSNVCKPIFEFGQGPYNTVRWNPQGSFFCLAGFGNLPGDVAFWSRESLKCFQTIKAPMSVTSEWSADGRYFMTATTAPRLQVDNGFKVFKYDGSLNYEKKYDKLYQADWRPASTGVYPDRPASPGARKPETKVEAPKSVQASTGTKPGAYRPPHAGQSASVKAQLFGEEEPSKKASAGSSGLSKSALKNQKRRQKKKEEGGAA